MFDAHCHVHPDLDPLPEMQPDTTANHRLLCGVGPEDWHAVARVARWWPGTLPAFGVHPWQYDTAPVRENTWEEQMRSFLETFPNAWVGEIGLDYLKATTGEARANQRDLCSRQLELAHEMNRPVNLHCIKAYDDLLALLDNRYFCGGIKACILHSFNGPHQMITEYARRGVYFTVGPLASRHDGRRVRARIALLPADRLLLESDAFLQPGIDEEEDLQYTLSWLADVRSENAASLATRIETNARRLLPHEDA